MPLAGKKLAAPPPPLPLGGGSFRAEEILRVAAESAPASLRRLSPGTPPLLSCRPPASVRGDRASPGRGGVQGAATATGCRGASCLGGKLSWGGKTLLPSRGFCCGLTSPTLCAAARPSQSPFPGTRLGPACSPLGASAAWGAALLLRVPGWVGEGTAVVVAEAAPAAPRLRCRPLRWAA